MATQRETARKIHRVNPNNDILLLIEKVHNAAVLRFLWAQVLGLEARARQGVTTPVLGTQNDELGKQAST